MDGDNKNKTVVAGIHTVQSSSVDVVSLTEEATVIGDPQGCPATSVMT